MIIHFETTDRDKILDDIIDAMGDRALSKIVNFTMDSGTLTVTISKVGTSKLHFSESEWDSGLRYELSKEKIALSHKAFKDEVTKKILNVIEQAGGSIA